MRNPKSTGLIALAFTLMLASGQSFADPLLNTVNDGAKINGGTYLNSPDGVTKFINSAGTGIHLEAGQNIRGAEYANGGVTGNGGKIHIDATGQVVRLDGNIDVRGFLPNGSSGNIGNGGNVTIDSAFLYQNGNIYAGGLNGGLVQMNVGGMIMGQNARIDATGQNFVNDSFREVNGVGGNVTINSSGNVHISEGAFISTNGANVNPGQETFYGNNIIVIGRGVNVDGTLYAGQVKPLDLNDRGNKGTIHISANGVDADLNIGSNAIIQADSGEIALNSGRNINQNGRVLNNGNSLFDSSDDTPWASGIKGYAGGITSLTAAGEVNNTGRIQADGHNSNGGDLQGVGPGFKGGNGGVITISAPSISNTGVIRAMGGNTSLRLNQEPETLGAGGDGGSVNFIGANPTGNGVVATFGGNGSTVGALGTISAPDPAASSNLLYGVWKKN